MTDWIAGAFLGMVETPEAVTDDYERWHATDHLPENLALPGVVFARRWRANPAALSGRDAGPSLAKAQFLMTYFFAAPLEPSVEAWSQLASRLGDAGRMFSDRSLPWGGLFRCAEGRVAGERPLSLEAMVHAPHRSVSVELGMDPAFERPDDGRWQRDLERPEAVGGLRFVQAGGPEYGTTVAGRAQLIFWEDQSAQESSDSSSELLFSGTFGASDPGFG